MLHRPKVVAHPSTHPPWPGLNFSVPFRSSVVSVLIRQVFWPPPPPPLPGSPPPPSLPPALPPGPPPPVPSNPCYGCARQGHLWHECPALKGQCRKCARTSHEEEACDIHKEDQRRFEAVHGRPKYAALAHKHKATVILLDGSLVLWFHGPPRSSLALVTGPRSNRIS